MSDLSFLKGIPGLKNWYSLWTSLIDWLQLFVTEVETARQGQPNLNAALNQYVLKSGWTVNFNAMNYRLTGLADPVNPQDAVNLQTAQALISGGGVPSNIPITALGIGTATALQLYRVNAGGTAIEGIAPTAIASDIANSNEMTYLVQLYGSL